MWNAQLSNELWKDKHQFDFKEMKRVDAGHLSYLLASVYVII